MKIGKLTYIAAILAGIWWREVFIVSCTSIMPVGRRLGEGKVHSYPNLYVFGGVLIHDILGTHM